MTSPPWVHLDPLPADGGDALVSSDEARHASGARRLRDGDAVTLFDGRGGVADGTIARVEKRSVIVAAGPMQTIARPTPALHIATALPKGDRLGVMLSMLAQVGATSVAPLSTRRAVVEPGRNFVERAERIGLEACKQSRNPWAPTIRATVGLDEVADATAVLAHPDGPPLLEVAADLRGATSVTLLIGPEGGFDDAEVEAAAAAGAGRASLGATILRIETAATVGLALLRAGIDPSNA